MTDARTRPAPAAGDPALFVVAFAVAVAFSGFGLGGPLGALLVLSSAVPLRWPMRGGPLVLLAAVVLGVWALRAPVASNHYTMLTFMAAGVVLAAGWAVLTRRTLDAHVLYAAYAAPLRWLIVPLYGFAILHKLNDDYADPATSCGALLWDRLAWPWGLADVVWMDHVALWGALVIELVAMLLLLDKRYKLLGVIVGLPLHVLIGYANFAFYMDFSCTVFALYALSMPPGTLDALFARVPSLRSQHGWLRSLGVGAVAFLGFNVASIGIGTPGGVVGWVLGPVYLDVWNPDLHALRFMPVFTLWVAVVCWTCAVAWRACGLTGPADGLRVRPGWLAIVPVVFTVNGFGPFLGLHTEHALAMYSNLRTEGGTSNHWLFRQVPQPFAYQDALFRVHEARSFSFPDGGDHGIVGVELARVLAATPGAGAVIEWQGERLDTDALTAARREALGIVLPPFPFDRLLQFRPVQLDGPQRCTH